MPATKTVRMSPAAHESLCQMAEEDDLSLADELAQLIEEKRRERFIQRANAEYERIMDDEEEAESYRQEMQSLDGTLADGLDGEW